MSPFAKQKVFFSSPPAAKMALFVFLCAVKGSGANPRERRSIYGLPAYTAVTESSARSLISLSFEMIMSHRGVSCERASSSLLHMGAPEILPLVITRQSVNSPPSG